MGVEPILAMPGFRKRLVTLHLPWMKCIWSKLPEKNCFLWLFAVRFKFGNCFLRLFYSLAPSPLPQFGLRETAGTIWAHLSTHSAAYCPRFANPSLWTLNEGNVALPPDPQEELVDPSCKADEERNLGWLVRSRIAWYKFLGPKTSNSVPALGKVQNWRRAGREVCQVLLTTHLCSTGGDRHANQNIKLQNGKYGRASC